MVALQLGRNLLSCPSQNALKTTPHPVITSILSGGTQSSNKKRKKEKKKKKARSYVSQAQSACGLGGVDLFVSAADTLGSKLNTEVSKTCAQQRANSLAFQIHEVYIKTSQRSDEKDVILGHKMLTDPSPRENCEWETDSVKLYSAC